jgi:hypothetical protein
MKQDTKSIIESEKIKIDDQGYDSRGQYYGIGLPVLMFSPELGQYPSRGKDKKEAWENLPSYRKYCLEYGS